MKQTTGSQIDQTKCWTCENCGKTYKRKYSLVAHIHLEHQSSSLPNESRVQKASVRKVQNSISRKKRIPVTEKVVRNCPVCSLDFPTKNLLIRHLLCHIPSDFMCHVRSKDAETGSTESKPEEEMCDELLVCNSCDSKFNKKRLLHKHLRSSHPDLFRIQNSRRRTTKVVRRKHTPQDYEEILVHDGRKENVEGQRRSKEVSECPHCKTRFSMKKNLLKHMKIIHKITDHEIMVYEERKPRIGHRCAECEKVFSLPKNLYQHLRKIHGKTDVGRKSSTLSDSVRLICDACGVGFSEKKSLTRHLRMKHAVKAEREKKTVAVCIHCNSTFAHRKSLYKHERKFHGADYKKIVKEDGKNDATKRVKEKLDKPGAIDDYECLKEILPSRSDYKLTQFAWLRHDNYPDVTRNWFKAKLHFFCDSKDEVKMWKESYEMLNKLCLRVLSFPRPRTPGVLYKGRFRCHHNTMPKKGAKPNAKHTACSAVLSITLLQSEQPEEASPGAVMKASVFLKNTHNHALGDAASLKYRKPIREVKEKFLKLFEAKKTVPQALAIHKADLEAEYGPEHVQSIVSDRAFMPDARWAYGLYYSCFKKKRDDTCLQDAISPEHSPAHSIEYVPSVLALPPMPDLPPVEQVNSQDPYKQLVELFKSVCGEIADRCDSSPSFFSSGLETFVSVYKSNCGSDEQLLSALQSFGRYCSSPTNNRTRSFQPRNMVGLQNVDFSNESMSAAASLHPFAKYNNVPVNMRPRITQVRSTVVQPTELAVERDLIIAAPNPPLTLQESQNGIETRTLYALETGKYDDSILYPIESRQNITTNCWIPGVPTEYGLF